MRYFIILYFALIVYGAQAQSYQLEITLIDEAGLAVSGASIAIGNKAQYATEDTFGKYHFKNLLSDTYIVQVSLQGFQSAKQEVRIHHKDKEVTIRIRSDPQQLSEVLIEGNSTEKRKQEAQLNMEIVDEDFIRRNMGGSLMQSLRKIPGIETIDIGSGQSKPMIRGMGFNRIAVIDKGIKHEAQQWGADHGLEIDQFAVDEVEILKGAASYEYGSDAIAGALNIKSPLPPPRHSFGGDLSLIGQSNNALYGNSVHLYGRTEKWFATGRVSYENYADYRVPTDNLYIYSYPVYLHHHRVRNTAGRELDYHFSTGYFGPSFHTDLYIDNTYSKSGFFANAHGLEPRGVDTEVHDRSSRDILKPNQQVNHFKITNKSEYRFDNHAVELELGYQNNHRKEHSDFVSHGHMLAVYPDSMQVPSDLEREFKKEVYSLNLKDRIHFDHHELSYGFSGEIQDNQIKGWSFLVPAYKQQTYGVFAHDKVRLNEVFILHAALRFDHSQIHIYPYHDWFPSPLNEEEDALGYIQRAIETKCSFNSITGGVGVNYNAEHWALKANLGKSYRVPIAKELGANGVNYHYFSYEKGNPNLDPEESYQADLSIGYSDKSWEIEASPFFNYFPNYIYLNPTADHDYLYGAGNQVYEYNQSRVQRYGGELTFNYHFLKDFKAGLSGEYLYAKQLSGDKKGYTLPFSPPPSVQFHLAYEPHKLAVFTDVYFSGDFRLTARQNRIVPPEQKTPGYGVFDFQLGGKFPLQNQQVELSLQVKNLWNTSYMVHTSFYRLIGMPEQGRNIVLSLKIPFNFLTKNKSL